MKFNTKGLVYNLKTKQNLPINVQEAWEFLSDPRNLQRITPKNMEFWIFCLLSELYSTNTMCDLWMLLSEYFRTVSIHAVGPKS